MTQERVIWQYWETRDFKPPFVDELRRIAEKNSGARVILVTPDSILDYIPDMPEEIHQIGELAHKADMIRALLISEHGGMWLDSDAIVLSDLGWLFELLSDYEFVGFNDSGTFSDQPLNVRVNCFLAQPGSTVMKEWVRAQHSKFPRVEFSWKEVGTDILDPVVAANRNSVNLLPFDLISPVKWNEVSRFSSKWENSKKILNKTQIVMLSNKSLQERKPELAKMSLAELAKGDTLIADIIRRSLDPLYQPDGFMRKLLRLLSPAS